MSLTKQPAVPARWQVLAAFAAVYLIWGSTYLAIRFAVESIPPLLMAGARFLLAGGLMYGWLRVRGTPAPQPRYWRGAFIAGGLLLLGGNGGVTWAEQTIPSSLAALLVALVPIWVALLAWGFEGRGMSRRVLAGIVLGFAGVLLLLGPGSVVSASRAHLIGALVVVVGSFTWAIGSLYTRRSSLPSDPFLATAMEMLGGGVLLVLVGLLLGEGTRVEWGAITPLAAGSFFYLVTFGSLIAFSAYIWLLHVSTPDRVSTYAYVNPVVAVMLGWALADEALTPQMLLAAAFVIGAVVMITGAQRPAARARHTRDEALVLPEGAEPI